jgi:predicted amino acid dehydrogenase
VIELCRIVEVGVCGADGTVAAMIANTVDLAEYPTTFLACT